MPVSLKVENTNGNNIMQEGIDLGLSRKGKPNISSFFIKNDGNILARDVTVSGCPLNTLQDVENGVITLEEYNRQEIAGKWKTFSTNPNGDFMSELNLGKIYAGKYLQGIEASDISTQSEGLFPFNAVHSNAEMLFKDNVFVYQKANQTSNGYSSFRLQHENPSKRMTRHFELTMNIAFNVDKDKSKWDKAIPYVSIPVRNNVRGDKKGYGFLFAYDREEDSVVVSVRTDMVGITSHYDGLLVGNALYQTKAIVLDSTKEFTVKCYDDTDEGRTPCFEVLYGGQPQLLYAVVGDAEGYVVKDDSSKAYKGAGSYYLECTMQEGDISISFSNMSIVTDLAKQPIYVRTVADDRAEDRTEYRSSIAITYYED